MTLIRKQRPARRGTVLVESALMIPIFLMIIFMIVEMGFFVSVRHSLENAARVGVRYASVNLDLNGAPNPNLAADTRTLVFNQIGFYGTSGIIIGIDPPTAGSATPTFQTPLNATNHILVRGYDDTTGTMLASPEACNLLDQVAVEIYAGYTPIVPVTRMLGIFGIFQGNVKCLVNVRMTAEYN